MGSESLYGGTHTTDPFQSKIFEFKPYGYGPWDYIGDLKTTQDVIDEYFEERLEKSDKIVIYIPKKGEKPVIRNYIVSLLNAYDWKGGVFTTTSFDKFNDIVWKVG